VCDGLRLLVLPGAREQVKKSEIQWSGSSHIDGPKFHTDFEGEAVAKEIPVIFPVSREN
jgi:hypothetical protein